MTPTSKGVAIAAAFVVYTGLVAATCFDLGMRMKANTEKAKAADTVLANAGQLETKNKKALAVGVRAERAQAKNDEYFQNLRSEYEADARKNPGGGCVLDDDSLRLWNAANAGPDGAAAGEPDGAVPGQVASAAKGAKPRGESPGNSADLPRVQD